jgi:hypothetical protein
LKKDIERYSIHITGLLLVLTLFAYPGVATLAQRQDLSFVAAIKGSRYDQSQDGKLTLSRFFFFTEIFLAEGGRATEATLRRTGSTGEPWEFEQEGNVLTFAGGYFPELKALDEAFPGEDYALDVTTPSGVLARQPISFAQAQGESRLPEPVTIRLTQDGKRVEPDQVDPQKALTVTWSEFTRGRSDPNHIVDALIFVILTGPNGELAAHSGRPFSGAPFLTYDAPAYEIPSKSLEPGVSYTLVVEHARVLNSDAGQAVPVFASYATATYLPLQTSQ